MHCHGWRRRLSIRWRSAEHDAYFFGTWRQRLTRAQWHADVNTCSCDCGGQSAGTHGAFLMRFQILTESCGVVEVFFFRTEKQRGNSGTQMRTKFRDTL